MLAFIVLCLLPGPVRWQVEGHPEPTAWAASGTAYLSPETFTVDEKQTLEYHYIAGPDGMAAGDSIRVEDPLFHGMTWAKWGHIAVDAAACTPREDGQTASIGVVTAYATSGATVTLSRNVDETAGLNDYAYTDVTVDTGTLAAGDELVLVYGDTTAGADCGLEMSDRAWHKVKMPAYESLDGGALTALLTVPTFDVVSQTEVMTLLVTAPSQAIAGVGADLQIAVMDSLGNPIEDWTGTISVPVAYGGAEYTLTSADAGVARLHVDLDTPGAVERVTVAGPDGLAATSNPIVVYDSGSPPTESIYWGDLHVHHGHSYTNAEGAYIDENIAYARDVIGLDFAAESQKTIPIEIDGEEIWTERQENCTGETEDGRFVMLLGFEWMGDHIGGENQGHHNFYFDTCDAPLGTLYDPTDAPDGIGAFASDQGPYAYADQLLDDGIQTVIIPHATLYTGRLFTGEAINNQVRTSAEVYSEWGFDMIPADREGSIPQALSEGNRMGFIAASDNHDGWMGNPFSSKSVRSGLAAIAAPALNRTDLFANLQARNTYATTGERMIVKFWAEDGADVGMGDEYIAERPTFEWEAFGTQSITSVELRTVELATGAQATTLYRWTPNTMDASGSYEYDWDEAPRAVWLDVIQAIDPLTLDADEAWTSPIWLSGDCAGEDVLDPAGRCLPDSGEDSDTSPDSDTDTDSDSDSAVIDTDSGTETAITDDGPGKRCNCASAPVSGGALLGLLGLGLLRRRPTGAA